MGSKQTQDIQDTHTMNLILPILLTLFQHAQVSAYPFDDTSDSLEADGGSGIDEISEISISTPATPSNIPENPPTSTTASPKSDTTKPQEIPSIKKTTNPETQKSSILDPYFDWIRSFTSQNLKNWQIILISVGVILIPIITLIITCCCIKKCCCKKPEYAYTEYDGPTSSIHGSTYSSMRLLNNRNKVNRSNSAKSMTRGDFVETEAILQTTLDRNKSRKQREQKEQIIQEFANE